MGGGSRRKPSRKANPWREGNTVVRKSSIGLGYLNANGWDSTTKHDVESAACAKSLDVFSLTETKKKPHSRKIEIEGFKVFEARRKGDTEDGGSDKAGGGLACAVRETAGISYTHYDPKISDPELKYVSAERLWVKYKSDHGKCAIGTVYCGFQASDNRHLGWNEGIYKVLEEEIRILRGEGYRVLLQGDFNAWIGCLTEHGGIPGNRAKVTPNGELFISFLSKNNLCNVNQVTRIVNGVEERVCKGLWTRHGHDYTSSSILDFVVVSKEHLDNLSEMVVDENGHYGGGSDHCMIFSRWVDKFIYVPKVEPVRYPGWNVEDANWDKFREVVRQEVEGNDIRTNDIDHLSDDLSRALTKGLNIAVGKRSSAPPKKAVSPRHIVNLLNERKALEKKFKSEKSRFARSADQSECGSLVVAKDNLDAKTNELNVAKSKFERQKRAPLLNLAKCKSRRNRKRFWDFVNRKTKKTSGLPPLQDKITGALKHDPQEIADEVFKYLKDIFSGSDHPQDQGDPSPDISLSDSPSSMAATVGNPGSQSRMDSRTGVGLQGSPSPDISLSDNPSSMATTDGNPGSHARMDSRTRVGDLYDDGDKPGEFNRDHEYCSNPNPKLPKSGTSGHSGYDPRGFLDKIFSIAEVSSIIKSLGNGKASGHDDLINEALKEAPVSFIKMPTDLFNMVKSSGRAPSAWKRGRVTLVHKKGPESDLQNYRPITVIPCMCSTYSKLLNARLTEVVEQHNLLGETQNGFRKDRCGVDSAFVLNSLLWKSVAKKKKVSLAFLDLQKAYDSVHRNTLWKKMAALGFGGQFLETIKSLYKDDYVTSNANGISTDPVYLGRGLRQGCSLSPILFSLYVSDMSRDLHASNLGVLLHKVCISCIFFADDIVLVSRDADGLRQLLNIVQEHCIAMKMTLSVTKSKVMSSYHDIWELFSGDQVIGSLDKVLEFKYLGVKTTLSPSKSATVMMNRAKSLAMTYKKTCLSIGYDGPDTVDLTLCLWLNVGMPSILYGCEFVPFTETVISEIERIQSSIGKFTLGLPQSSPNISTTTILGTASFKELLYTAQLKYLVRLLKQDNRRWSKDAFLDQVRGEWESPYIRYMSKIKGELGLHKWPGSIREVKVVVYNHFLEVNNRAIESLALPALQPLAKRARMDFANESQESQVFVYYFDNLLMIFQQ